MPAGSPRACAAAELVVSPAEPLAVKAYPGLAALNVASAASMPARKLSVVAPDDVA